MANMWTPQERNAWIDQACSSSKERETKRGHCYHTMTKQLDSLHIAEEDPKRSFVTNCLAKAMYSSNPILKRLSFCFYKLLMNRVSKNSFLETMQRRHHFIIVVKGSNAYKLLLKSLAKEIEHSDLDIVVFINPALEDDLYMRIKDSLVIAITQTISIYKRDLEATLFHETENSILRQDLVTEFKTLYANMLDEYSGNGKFLSPFYDDDIRNQCSKRSFVIFDRNTAEENEKQVVRIEVPHFDMCEFIPLKKSPLVVSYNKTIQFNRDVEGKYRGCFELIRMRLNNLFVSQDNCDATSQRSHSSWDDTKEKLLTIPADFIDVSIPLKGDAVLEDFWKNNGPRRCYEVYDKFVGANVMIPNVNQCISDLSNILHLYTNGQFKAEKRQKRLELFQRLDEERKRNGLYGESTTY